MTTRKLVAGAGPGSNLPIREALLRSLRRLEGRKPKSRQRRLQLAADALVDRAIAGETARLANLDEARTLMAVTTKDLRTATRNRTRLYLPPVLEYVAYAGFSAVAPAVLPNADEISPLQAAPRVPPSARVLVLAGGADRRARPVEAAAVATAVGGRAELVVIEGGDHLRLAAADPAGYRKAIFGLLEWCSQPEK